MLKQKIELLHRSSERLMAALDLPKDSAWWGFIRQEVWVHLKRTLELLWAVVRKEVNGDGG